MDENRSAPQPVFPYQNARQTVTDEDLASWQVRPDDDTGRIARIFGPCPRCDHPTAQPVGKFVDLGAAAAGTPPLPSAEGLLTQSCRCACEEQHLGPANAAAQQPGCGAWWQAAIILKPKPGEQQVRAPADDTMLDAARTAAQMPRPDGLAVRAAAEKWLGAVIAIVGLFGLAGVVSGKDAFTGLPLGVRIGSGIAAGLALLAAVTAILFAYTAAYGWPVLISIGNDKELAVWYDKHNKMLRAAPGKLRNAVIFALASLALLSGVAGCIWFWPRAAPAQHVLVQFGHDSEVCGTLVSSTERAQLRIRRTDDTIQVVRFAMIKSIAPVSGCPA
ncbi:hypothetical protein [Catenulispora rubra]|uniref:hypothetical protein n=1 Tax=Catenulispora rubra TaxID=280293 RepID=UPI0018926695|nr:hypothetical protein [Catenulispora rubra]